MKKITLIIVSVLLSTLVFANGTVETSGSAVEVTSSNRSNLVKLFYKAPQMGTVKVTIRNESNQEVYSETIRQSDGFIRPYNFSNLPEGNYSVIIEDAFGKQVKKFNYHTERIVNSIHIAKVAGADRKILLTGTSHEATEIKVRIYDNARQTAFDRTVKVNGEFGEVYNISALSNDYTIEVSDSRGVIKSMTH